MRADPKKVLIVTMFIAVATLGAALGTVLELRDLTGLVYSQIKEQEPRTCPPVPKCPHEI